MRWLVTVAVLAGSGGCGDDVVASGGETGGAGETSTSTMPTSTDVSASETGAGTAVSEVGTSGEGSSSEGSEGSGEPPGRGCCT